MSKSPRKVLATAWAVAQNVLPRFSHKCSPKKITQHQLFACLVLKVILKTDYRGLAAHLSDCPALREAIELTEVPYYTTFQKRLGVCFGSTRLRVSWTTRFTA